MVGIGGVGMSALAQLLVSRGVSITGSDRSESPTTELLSRKGIVVSIGHDGCLIPANTEMVIYSDAVWPDNPERMRAVEMKIPQISYFEGLARATVGMRTVAVAGTHGKTTTTGMLAKILIDAGVSPTVIVGSIVRDFDPHLPKGEIGRTNLQSKSVLGSNFVKGKSDICVVEACEYRDHLLELSPEVLVITNIELDHTDFFPSLSALQNTFRTAVEKVPRTGAIVTNQNDPHIKPVLEHAQARIVDYTQMAVGSLLLPGEFNRENARAALAAAHIVAPKLSLEAGVHSLSQFKGSWRRFEYKGEMKSGVQVYDDYAHHPTAVEKTIAAAREKFPGKKVVVAFHPHLFSRTRDFMDEFAQALSGANEILLAPIFPAREKPIEGITSEVLAEKIVALGTSAKAFTTLHNMYDYCVDANWNDDTVLLTMGAGDIYKVAEQLTEE